MVDTWHQCVSCRRWFYDEEDHDGHMPCPGMMMELFPETCSHKKPDLRALDDLLLGIQRGSVTLVRAKAMLARWLAGENVKDEVQLDAPIHVDPDSPRAVLEWLIDTLGRHMWAYPRSLAKQAADALVRSDEAPYRTFPVSSPDLLDRALDQLEGMPDQERSEFFLRLRARFCLACGSKTDHRPCFCENDE